MRYGRYVGRVGALAVALGIGTAVATPAGIAWATPDSSADSSASSGTDANTGTGGSSTTKSPATGTTAPATGGATTGTPTTDEPKTSEPDEPKTGSSGTGGDDATDADKADTPKPKPKSKKSTVNGHARVTETSKATTKSAQQPSAQTTTGSTASKDEDAADSTEQATVSVAASQLSATATTAALSVAQPAAANPVQAISTLISSVVRPVLSAFLGVLPDGPMESPLAWLVLAAARRQVGQTEDVASDVSAQRTATAQTVAAAVTNAPPTATVTFGRPDATTGTVLGQLTTHDPEGQPVAVTLKTAPSAGALTYDADTGAISYTPTTAQRFVAATTSNPNDTIAMSIAVTDGVNNVVVPINIPVSPSPFYKRTDFTSGLSNPSAVAAAGTRAYITNSDKGTVTVYDTVKNTVVATYQVGAAPDGIAVKSDGSKLYVSSSTKNTVTVIDTATGATKKTLTVANPTAITINPSGSTVYVANGSAGTITKIGTTYNTVSGTAVKLATGLKPTEIAVSSDGKKIYVASAKATGGGNVSVFSSTSSTVTSITNTTGKPTGLAVSAAYPRLFVSADDGVVTVVDTSTSTAITRNLGVPLNGIAVTNDSSAVMVTNGTGLVAALSALDGSTLGATSVRDSSLPPMSVQPGVVLSPDGTQLFVTDYDKDSVHVVSLVPPNIAPFSSDPYYSVSDPTKGTVTGKVGVVDFDGDPLTYVVTSKPTKGTLVVKADGTYTYTPTATARHAASVPTAAASVKTDSFTIQVSDGRNGTVNTTITVAIDPANKVPTVKTTIGNPSSSTGVVKGSVTATDGDSDKRTYTVTGGPTKGTVAVTSTGSFTYTPTAAARAAATAAGATYAKKMDTFTVKVDDGHGGVVSVTVKVKIGASNVKPTGATATASTPNPRTGVVTGAITATDADGDPLTYTAGTPTKGTLVLNSNGTYTYTPTAAARLAASKAGASSTTKSETITITVSDGFGGTTTTSLKVSIAPNPTVNHAPTNGVGTVQGTTSAIGNVTGTVTAADSDGDKLTYSLGSGPAFGDVKVTSAGKFTYTPDVDARYRALVTPGVDTDTFTVNISDGFGGTTTATVKVNIAPPSASAIDQRSTTVAVTAQQMYFYSQTDTDKAMGLLKNAGVDTIRILMPWGGIESEENTYDWGAVDRMVNSANANGIKVLAVLNSTPDWAAVPGQPDLAGSPTNLSAFGDFASAVATRYKGKVADYEIWNEPNYKVFWSPAPDAAQYTALLKVGYTAIKAADPNATVIAASVSAAAETPGGPVINPVTYLSEMYAAGASGYFDAISYHPYLYSLAFSAGEGHAGVPITQAEQLHAVMVANGDGNKKIWATEYGQPSSEFSEANQAAYIGDFLRTWRDLDFAGPAFIHTLADYPSSDPVQASFGLFHQDWTPKPALDVVKQVIAENNAIEAAADDV